ncbi:hypothetical protein [Streptomyces sp. NPDC046976]|uniref:hypothetical protein n=1 Tax=Streptomyces sp. NPDC046976 TaxID=3155258 RepID=UPI0033F37149
MEPRGERAHSGDTFAAPTPSQRRPGPLGPSLQVFFIALTVLAPLVAVLPRYARPVGVLLAAVVMTADALGNRYVNRSRPGADRARPPHPVGMLPLTLFTLFVLASAIPPAHAPPAPRPVPVG